MRARGWLVIDAFLCCVTLTSLDNGVLGVLAVWTQPFGGMAAAEFERAMSSGSRTGRRGRALSELQWSAEEVAVLERAERLQSYGLQCAATTLVAVGCELPQRFRASDVAVALQLDVSRWYRAFTGEAWDGRSASFSAARNRATRLRHSRASHADAVSLSSGPVFRNTHLFVEPWDGRQNAEVMEDFTIAGLWPQTLDVGRLEWDDPNGFCCAFCDALLLPSEADVVPGAPGVHKGKYCCATGHVLSSNPPPLAH
jgi:hypothetical protein